MLPVYHQVSLLTLVPTLIPLGCLKHMMTLIILRSVQAVGTHSIPVVKESGISLHRVLDYLEDKNFEKISERSVKRVYYKTFLLMMKADILKETELYELEDDIHLPRCMLEGSYKEAFDLMDKDRAYEFMKTQRVWDVQRHLEKIRNDVFRGSCEGGEKIVEYGKK